MEEPIKALLATFLFQDLSPAEVEPLAARTTALSLRSGQFLHRAGDPADEVWVLTSGQLKAWMPSEGGEEFVFDVLVPPQLMGLPGVFAQARTRLINTVATQESSLITVPATALRETMRTHPAVTWRALERLAEIARSYSDALLDVAYSNVTLRVAKRLLDLCAQHGEPVSSGVRIPLKVSQTTLAGMVGATREGVNRALGTLVRQRIMFSDSGTITVCDLEALRARAGGDVIDDQRSLNRSA